MSWRHERVAGAAADFHRRDLPPERAVWWFEPERPALVLGSSQREAVVDAGAASAHGVEVVRRRSGGGAVLLVPGEVLWVDVVVPRGDPQWHDDVGVAFHWLGAAWAEALRAAGVDGALVVHRGRLLRTAWSDLVCFAGLGPGEVTLDGRKVVGISQRRWRDGARFQCAVHRRWNGPLLGALLAEPKPSGAELAAMAVGIGGALDALPEAFAAALTRR